MTLLLALLACGTPDPGDTAAPADTFVAPDTAGPYDVSATTLDWTDARGRTLRAEVWYPVTTCDEPEPYEEVPAIGTACRDEAPDTTGAPYPLVAFSHGNGGIRYQSIFLTEALARHGYVVVAVDHPRNTLLDFDETAASDVALLRPGDVVASVDEVFRRSAEGDRLLGGLVAPDRYAMTGHSFGAWTTLAVAGNVADLDGFREFCATNEGYDLCGILDGFAPGATIADAPDPRAVAAIPMAVGAWYSFGDQSGAAPTLVLGGDHDEGFPPDRELQPLYDRLPAPKALGVLAGAGHFAFSDICAIGDLVEECGEEEAGYIALDTAHTIIDALAIAWIGLHLRGDARYGEWIADRWDELTLQQE